MKKDIDNLMRTYNIDALLVTGPTQHNPFMVYLTGGAHMTEADLIKRVGEKAILFYNMIEREEAKKTGLDVCDYNRYALRGLLKDVGNDYVKAIVLRYVRMLGDMGTTSGKVALYGQIDLGRGYKIFSALQRAMPQISFIGYQEYDILSLSMMTKDLDEVERIKRMGEISEGVVARVCDFLRSHRIEKGNLIKKDGDFLCVGEVKRKIDLWLAELGAENPHGTIFSIGRDTAVPHNTGTSSDIIRTGVPIIFDIFPCECAGGYYHDLTRTWCLGYATDEMYKIYEQVRSVYEQVYSQLRVNEYFTNYQKMTCDLFEGMGHQTICANSETIEGYNHSLGHGVGLRVHERPFCGDKATYLDTLAPGTVFTLEPGLYYPDRNIGVRLENTIYLNPDGKFEVLIDYPMDLVVPVRNSG